MRDWSVYPEDVWKLYPRKDLLDNLWRLPGLNGQVGDRIALLSTDKVERLAKLFRLEVNSYNKARIERDKRSSNARIAGRVLY